MPQVAAVKRATGRDRSEWFELLDKWGARGKPYAEISSWLTEKHGVSRWWAQKLIVEYEQDRGVRSPGVRRDGTFEVGASKTVAVPVTRLYESFTDPRRRKRWLTDGRMKLQSSQPRRSARFGWEDGATRVVVDFAPKGPSKAMVSVVHQKLPDAGTAATTKLQWRERLNELRSVLESN